MEKITQCLRPYREAPEASRLDVLDGFRALFILLIGWYHIWQQGWLTPVLKLGETSVSLDPMLRSGYMWVDGLLLLSAFLLYLPYTQSAEKPKILPFYRRRLIRILPSYLLCLLFFFVIALIKGSYPSASDAMKDVGAHLLFIHNLFPFSAQQTPLNGALWTLAVEMQFYLLFPFMARAFRRLPVLTYAVMTAAAFAFRSYAAGFEDTAMLINQFPAFLDVFANGFAAASAFAALKKALGKNYADRRIRLLFTVLLCVCVCALARLAREQSWESGYAAIRLGQMNRRFSLSVLIGCAMVCAAFSLTGVRFLLGNRLMAFLASVSFQFYMYHQPLAVWLKGAKWLPHVSETPWIDGEYAWQLRFTLCSFLSAFLLAVLITYLFEKPVTRLLKKHTK